MLCCGCHLPLPRCHTPGWTHPTVKPKDPSAPLTLLCLMGVGSCAQQQCSKPKQVAAADAQLLCKHHSLQPTVWSDKHDEEHSQLAHVRYTAQANAHSTLEPHGLDIANIAASQLDQRKRIRTFQSCRKLSVCYVERVHWQLANAICCRSKA